MIRFVLLFLRTKQNLNHYEKRIKQKNYYENFSTIF